jgi:hypothetical protein
MLHSAIMYLHSKHQPAATYEFTSCWLLKGSESFKSSRQGRKQQQQHVSYSH